MKRSDPKGAEGPVVEFVDIARRHAGATVKKMRGVVEHAVRTSIYVAVSDGMRFHKDDFRILSERCSNYGVGWEGLYGTACKVGNISAAQSYEHWLERPPFILDGSRLYVGAAFFWPGVDRHIVVTSFAQDQQSLIACLYEPETPTSRVRRTIAGMAKVDGLKVIRRMRLPIERVREVARTVRDTRCEQRRRKLCAELLKSFERSSCTVDYERIRGLTIPECKQADQWLNEWWNRGPPPRFLGPVQTPPSWYDDDEPQQEEAQAECEGEHDADR